MEKKFELTRPNDKRLKKLRLIAFLLWILFTIGAIIATTNEWKTNPFTILIIIVLIVFIIAPIIYPRYKLIGELTLGTEKILINEFDKPLKEYFIDSIENLEIKFRGTKGDSFSAAVFGIAALASKDGSGNKLSFLHLDKLCEFEFFSRNDMDYKAINLIFKEIEKKGLKVALTRIEY